MRTAVLDITTLETLLSAAVAAPSIHNTQPWHFRLAPETLTLEIRAAIHRGLRHTDPAGRALHLSVGCAVLNLRIAVEHFGRQPVTRLLPRPDEPDLLATVRLGGTTRTSPRTRLYDAVRRRHSSRFLFTERPLPASVLRLTGEAEHRNTSDPDRTSESRRWVKRDGRHRALGMTPEVLGPQDVRDRIPMRDFGAHRHTVTRAHASGTA